MGHMRIGFLPRRKQWNAIVEQLSLFVGDQESVRQIAEATLKAIQNNYARLPYDESIIKAMKFLAVLSFSANAEEQSVFLNKNGCNVDNEMTLFSIMASAQGYISTEYGSLEVNKMACDAVLKSVMLFYDRHKDNQLSLFGNGAEETWRKAGTGAAFCEMARSFIAEITEKQLRYCIEREAARTINDFGLMQAFDSALSVQSTAISNHALDISKLMQSWAAGWYNKEAVISLPSDEQLHRFLEYSFSKMREEFRREADVNE
jgi:hypothetical protein